MNRVHFIAIGDPDLSKLALALSKRKNYKITGSDEKISEPFYSLLKERNLLPPQDGWSPEKITKDLQAVVLGPQITMENPEYIKAKQLGVKIYSFPEYLFQQTRSKTRIVVAGTNDKVLIALMIVHVLQQLRLDADYMIRNQNDGSETMIKLSYESRIAILVGDEYYTSTIDQRPMFHMYKPHIAILTALYHSQTVQFSSYDDYLNQFKLFVDKMEVQGRLIYLGSENYYKQIIDKLRRDIVPFSYSLPVSKVVDGIVNLKYKKNDVPLMLGLDTNLSCIEAARIGCRQIGVTDEQFYNSIKSFDGKLN
jgi:UDP-N-acetylmuramate: L-alanyl-gamma-D-glutamyl-meso-diaminopimelate ligase